MSLVEICSELKVDEIQRALFDGRKRQLYRTSSVVITLGAQKVHELRHTVESS